MHGCWCADFFFLVKDEKLQKLVQQMQQHDKTQIELKQQLADVKKKLLESQTEIVKLHCKLQEVPRKYWKPSG